LFAAGNKRNKLKEFMIVGRMRVCSPKLDSSINGGLSLAVEFDKSAQLTELSLDSESNHALLKGSLPSHFGDPDDGHFSDDGKQEEEEGAEPKGKGRRIWSSHWLWITWSQPFTWIIMLCRELDVSFVFGVMVVYGVSQGVGFATNRVAVDYYWRDVQGEQPSMVQFYRGITWIPWDVKPLYGLLTDLLPVVGYHRRPYFVLSGVVTMVAYLVVILGGKLHVATVLAMFVGGSAAAAFADVTIDAMVATKSRQKPELATHIQSLCSVCSSLGGLTGYLLSGLAVHLLGSQGALGIMLLPGVLLFVLGFVIYEPRLPHHLWYSGKIVKQMLQACTTMFRTLMQKQVWQPTIYMYLSWALCPDISEGKFYWLNDKSVGAGLSEEFVGVLFALGAVGALLGAWVYHQYMRHWTFRNSLLCVQLLFAASGMLDVVLVTHVNRKLQIPDYVFAVVDEAVSSGTRRIKWLPLLVLAAKICPPGIEGTFFAFLMSVDNMGLLSSSWAGGVLLKVLGVTRSNFRYLWLAFVIRNLMRLLPLLFLHFIPNTNSDAPILPPELFETSDTSDEDASNNEGSDTKVHRDGEGEDIHLIAMQSPKTSNQVE